MTTTRGRASALATMAFVVGLVLLGALSGVPIADGILVVAALALQVLAGALVWRAVRPDAFWLEALGMGMGIGTAVSAVSGTLTTPWIPGGWGWILPSLVVIPVWIVHRVRTGPGLPSWTPPRGSTLPALVFTFVLGLISLMVNIRNYPLSRDSTWTAFHSDMPFFEALTHSYTLLGPWESIFSPDMQIRYHGLTYAWAGQVSQVANLDTFAALSRVLPVVSIVGVALVGIAWTQRLTASRWAPSLTVVLLLAGGYLGATYGTVLNFDSPSQALGALWLITATVVVVQVLTEDSWSKRRAWMGLTVLALVGFALTGGKVSSSLVLLGALAFLALVGLVLKKAWLQRAVGVFLLSSAAAAAAFFLLISGASDAGGLQFGLWVDRASSQQGLNPIPGTLGVVAGTVILILAISARWLGLVWLIMDRRWRTRPETLLGVGMAVTALAAVALLNDGLNETWFAVGASAPLSVLSAVGVSDAWAAALRNTRLTKTAFAGITIVAAAVTFAIVWNLWTSGPSGGNVWVSTSRWLGPIAAILFAAGVGAAIAAFSGRSHRIVAAIGLTLTIMVLASGASRSLGYGTGLVGVQPGFREEFFTVNQSEPVRGKDFTPVREITPDMLQASDIIRRSAARGLTATSLTWSAVVPALTGRQTYVSGVQFQVPYGRPESERVVIERDRDTFAFLRNGDSAAAQHLCAQDVRWLWLAAADDDVSLPGTKVVFRSPTVTLLALRCGEFPPVAQ